MELYNRRLLLLNEDLPTSSPRPPQDAGPISTNSSLAPSLFGRPSKLPAPSAFSPNVAYIILILLTALFLLGFIALYIRTLADDSPTAVSSRRRRRPAPSSSNSYSPSDSCGGLDQTTLQSLPVFAYDGEAKHQDDCAICLSEFQDGENVKMIPHCKHAFHPECINTWLFSHVTCPICRGTKLFPVKRQRGLGKVELSGDQGVCGHQRGSTVENGETWREGRVVGIHSQRRSSSCTNLGDRVVLPRTLSY